MKEKYFEMLENNDYESLANIGFINELVTIKYKDKYLIEYLLEKKIHSAKMDDCLRNNVNFARFYLKYQIIKPLVFCSLRVLFDYDNDNNLIFDLVLDNLSHDDQLALYQYIKMDSYNEFYERERDIVDIFLRHGIILPIIFIKTNLELESQEYIVSSEDMELINEFYSLFRDNYNETILSFIIGEFKRCLQNNHNRTISDIKKLIKFKKKNPQFCLIDSKGKDDSYDEEINILKTNTTDRVTFEHEFSHFLYSEYEHDDEENLNNYELLRKKVLDSKRENIANYLYRFHQNYELRKKEFEKEYFDLVKEKYDNWKKYIEVVCKDMLKNMPSMLKIWNDAEGYYAMYTPNEMNVEDIILEFLTIEKEEYIKNKLSQYYAEELMMENMFDALLMGELFDSHLSLVIGDKERPINCLSGHGGLYYVNKNNRSFDECVANFDAIKKSDKSLELMDNLREIIGDEMCDYLENYIKKNRESEYGHR